MRLLLTLTLLLALVGTGYADTLTVQVDRDNGAAQITDKLVLTPANLGAATAAQVDAVVASLAAHTTFSAAKCDGTTDDAATINTELVAASVAGGTVQLPQGKTCTHTATIVLRDHAVLDLNGSTLKWTGGANGVMVSTSDITQMPIEYPAIIKGQLDPGSNVVTGIAIDSAWYPTLDVRIVSGNTNMTALLLTAKNRHVNLKRWNFGTRFFNIRNFESQTTKDFIVFSGENPSDALGLGSVTIASGGTGYTKDDIVTVTGGGGNAQMRVYSVSGGVVTGVTPYDHGTGYGLASNVATSGGTGTGLTLNIVALGAFKPVTNGEIINSNGFATTRGYTFEKYADNIFLRGQNTVNLTADNARCAVFNDYLTGSGWVGIVNDYVDNLVCWVPDTSKTGIKGVVLNRSEGSTVRNLTQDPETYWGSNSIFTDNYSRSHSVTVSSAGAAWGQKVYQKGTGIYFSPPSVYPGYKTLLQPDATAAADNTVTLPKTSGTLALKTDIPTGTGDGTLTVSAPSGGSKTVGKQTSFDANGNLVASIYDIGAGASTTLQHDGVNNGSQTVLNLKAGTNMTLTDNGTGQITLDATSGSTGAPSAATYIVQTTSNQPTNAQVLSSLASGLLYNTTGTGVLSTLGVGTSANNVLQLNGSAQIPAVSGALLTNLPNQLTTAAVTLNPSSTSNLVGTTITRGNPDFSTASGVYELVDSSITLNAANPAASSVFRTYNIAPFYSGGGTLTGLYGVFLSPRNTGTGTIGSLVGINIWPRNTSSGTVTGMTSLYLQAPSNSGTIGASGVTGIKIDNHGLSGVGTSYGIKIDDQSGSSNNYAIYTGTGKVYHGDDVAAKTFTGTIPAATTYAATTTIDLALGDSPSVTLTGNPTLAFSNPKAGQWHRLNLIQDATGNRTVTWPSTGLVCSWRNTAGNVAPTLLTGAGKVDTIIIHTLSTTSAECWTAGNK